MTALFANTVTLRGFLSQNAETPASDGITNDAYAILLLATVSGVWDLGANEWLPRTTGIASSAPVHSSAVSPAA